MNGRSDPRARRPDFITWILALICAAALGWAGYECWEARRAAAQLAGLEQSNRQAESELRAAEASSRTELRKTATLRAEGNRLEPVRRPKPRFADPKEASRQFNAAHPEARALGDRIMRELANSWPRIAGQAAGFSQAQMDAYAELWARQKMNVPYIVDGIRVPTSGDLTDVQGGMLKQLVGNELYDKYEASLHDGGAHSEAAGVAWAANTQGAPLSSDQDQQLAQALTAAQKTPGDQGSTDWEAVERQAGSFLSPPQMDALRSNKAIWDEMRVWHNYQDAFIKASQGTSR